MIVSLKAEVWCLAVNVILQFGKWLLKDEVDLD